MAWNKKKQITWLPNNQNFFGVVFNSWSVSSLSKTQKIPWYTFQNECLNATVMHLNKSNILGLEYQILFLNDPKASSTMQLQITHIWEMQDLYTQSSIVS